MSSSHSIADSHADPISIHGGSVDQVKEDKAEKAKRSDASFHFLVELYVLLSPFQWVGAVSALVTKTGSALETDEE